MLIKKVFVILVIFAAPFIFSSCTSNSKEEISFTSWGSATELGIIKKSIENFESENPGIKINFEHIPQNYFQKLHLLFASNNPPDVLFINNFYIPVYEKYLEPVDNLINSNEYYAESLKSMSYGGHLLAVPRDISILVLYRNKELTNQTPKDLDEYKHMVGLIKPFGTGVERDVYFLFPYMMTLGEDIYNMDKTIAYYQNLRGVPQPAEVGSLTMAQMFIDRKLGFYLSGRWMYPKIKEKAGFSWDIILFPGTVPLDSSGWAISKKSKHKEAAKKFIHYMQSEKSIENFASCGLIIPARIDVSKKIDNKMFLEAIKHAAALKVDKNYTKAMSERNRELFN